MISLFSLNLDGAFQELFTSFISGVPKFLLAVAIVIIGFIVAKSVKKIIKAFLEKIGVDKLGEKLNEIELVDKSNIKIILSTVIATIFYYLIFLLFLVLATDALGMPAVSNLVKDIIDFVPNLITALIILVLGVLLAEALRNIVHTALSSFGVPSARLISIMVFYFLFINIFISALSQAKIETGFLEKNISILIGGLVLAFSIGYGLATKKTMSNYIGSFYIKNKISIGSKVRIGNVTGEVIQVEKTSLAILSDQNTKVYVPLSVVSDQSIEILN